MFEFSAYVAFNKATHGQTDIKHEKISKLDLYEGGSFSTAIFNSDIQLCFFPFSRFISVCRFVKGNCMPKIRTLFCLADIQKL